MMSKVIVMCFCFLNCFFKLFFLFERLNICIVYVIFGIIIIYVDVDIYMYVFNVRQVIKDSYIYFLESANLIPLSIFFFKVSLHSFNNSLSSPLISPIG